MTTTPAGLPAWSRAASHTYYGGDLNKRDYMDQGIVDALTDVSAAQLCRMAADLEAAVRVAPFCVLTYLNRDAAAAAPRVESAYSQVGVTLVEYESGAPPANMPSGVRNGDGDVTFTLAASYADPYSVSAAYTPRMALATGHNSAGIVATVTISGVTIRVRLTDSATGAAVSEARATLVIW